MPRTFEYDIIALTRKKPIPATSPTIDHQAAVSRGLRFEEESCKSSKPYDRALAIRKRVNRRQQVSVRVGFKSAETSTTPAQIYHGVAGLSRLICLAQKHGET